MKLDVKRAGIEDLDQLCILFEDYRRFYDQDNNFDASFHFLKEMIVMGKSIIFIACIENVAVGFTQLFTTYSSVFIKKFYILNDLYVAENFRKRGVARALLQRAIDFSKKENVLGLALETGVNNPAQILYEKMGWKKNEDFYHYFKFV